MNKSKIAMTVVVVVMALAIVGLTIGLILTAAQLSVQNSMTVTYSVEDVKASIVASGEIHEGGVKLAENGDITITGGNTEANNGNVVIDTTAQDKAVISGAAFATVALSDDGHAVYIFAITNDGSVNDMKVDVSVINTATDTESGENLTLADANIKMGVAAELVANDDATAKATAITNATKADASAILSTVTVGAQETVYVVIAFSVIDTGAAANLTAHATIALTDSPVA